jgi:hypothetical protein
MKTEESSVDSPVNLDELEALLDPTRGDWSTYAGGGDVEIRSGKHPHDCIAMLRTTRATKVLGAVDVACRDAALIVALRNAAPALIAEVRMLRRRVDRLIHGRTIEGDEVCEHAIEQAELHRLRAIGAAARAFVAAIGGAGTAADDQLLDLKEALSGSNVNGVCK